MTIAIRKARFGLGRHGLSGKGNYGDPAWPFGGYKQSGWGREMGKEVMEHYTEVKAVAARLCASPMLLPQWLELALSIGAGLAIGAGLPIAWATLKKMSRPRSVPGERVP